MASVCITAPSELFDNKEIGYFAEWIKMAARFISKELGYQDMKQIPIKQRQGEIKWVFFKT